MSHSRILATYCGTTVLVAATLGGYVACGAQTYRVPVDDDMGGASTASVGSSASNQTATNLVGVHSSKGWSTHLPIRFRVAESMGDPLVAELRAAMSTWEAAVGKTLFQFEGREKREGDSFKTLYSPLSDLVNGHYLDNNWTLVTGKPKTVLATTIWENDPHDPQSIAKSDIRYNAETYIFGDSLVEFSQGNRTIVDLQSLALHEVGHLLGLTHISTDQDKFSAMNPALFIGEGMITRRLSRGDIERLRSIYGVGDVAQGDALETSDGDMY